MVLQFRVSHSALASEDAIVDAMCEAIARYSPQNQIADSSVVYHESRETLVTVDVVDGSRPAVFPCAGRLNIPGEYCGTPYVRVLGVLVSEGGE
jgi:hypothetical protein